MYDGGGGGGGGDEMHTSLKMNLKGFPNFQRLFFCLFLCCWFISLAKDSRDAGSIFGAHITI